MVHLKMLEGDRKVCPFVSREGCCIYENRPAACRTYPIAQASRRHRVHKTVLEQYFLLRENHFFGIPDL